jgi:hypothetical protein
MSILTRLRSDIWVDAYRRRAEIAGGYVTIRQRGAAEAGAIFLIVTNNEGGSRLYGPAPQSLYDEGATSRRFIALNTENWDALQVQTMLDKQKRFDPDLWLVDVDDREGRHFLREDEQDMTTQTIPPAPGFWRT